MYSQDFVFARLCIHKTLYSQSHKRILYLILHWKCYILLFTCKLSAQNLSSSINSANTCTHYWRSPRRIAISVEFFCKNESIICMLLRQSLWVSACFAPSLPQFQKLNSVAKGIFFKRKILATSLLYFCVKVSVNFRVLNSVYDDIATAQIKHHKISQSGADERISKTFQVPHH
jgi:hypothetical protein